MHKCVVKCQKKHEAIVGVTRSMKSAGSRRILATKYQRVRVTPPLFPSMDFCPRRGLFGNGDGRELGEDCYHWGFGHFCELKTHPSVLGLLENTLTRGGPGVVTCDGLKWKLNYN